MSHSCSALDLGLMISSSIVLMNVRDGVIAVNAVNAVNVRDSTTIRLKEASFTRGRRAHSWRCRGYFVENTCTGQLKLGSRAQTTDAGESAPRSNSTSPSRLKLN